MSEQESQSRKPAAWFQPNSTMTPEQVEAACKEQIQFPKVVKKKRDPPIVVKCEKCKKETTQTYAGLSFMILDKPIKGISAFVKVRGAWETKEDLVAHAKNIIIDTDSLYATQGVEMGSWVPVTTDSKYVAEEVLVREDLTTGKIEDDPIKKAEDRHKAVIEQLRQREKILRDDSAPDDPTSDKDGIEYYGMRKVTIKSIQEYIAEGEEKLNELKKTRDEMVKEVRDLDEKHPDYKEKWIDVYNQKRKEVGLPPVTKKSFKLPFEDLVNAQEDSEEK